MSDPEDNPGQKETRTDEAITEEVLVWSTVSDLFDESTGLAYPVHMSDETLRVVGGWREGEKNRFQGRVNIFGFTTDDGKEAYQIGMYIMGVYTTIYICDGRVRFADRPAMHGEDFPENCLFLNALLRETSFWPGAGERNARKLQLSYDSTVHGLPLPRAS